MSTTPVNTSFRVLTPAMMKEYEKEQEEYAKAALKQEELEDVTPQEPITPVVTKPDEEETYKKRYSDLKTHYDSSVSKERREKDELTAKLKATQDELAKLSTKRYATPEAIAEFEKTYDVSPILKQVAADVTDERVAAAVAKMREEQFLEKEKQERINKDVAKLSKVHPDWATLQDDPIFLGWLDKQSPTTQRLADYSTTEDMDGAIMVLNLFKAEVKVKPNSPNTNKSLSTNPVTSRADIPAPKEGQISIATIEKQMTAANKKGNKTLEEKLYNQMMQAYAEGRLIP